MLSLIVVLCLHMLVIGVYEAAAAASHPRTTVAGAKKEGEVTLIASASTFGGKKGFAELEAAFNKRYGLTSKVNLAPGPSFPQVAARVMSELKAGAKSSTDLYLGSDGTMSDTHREKALQSQLVGCLPWVTKEMEILPQETLLVYASFHGIIYNSNAIPKDKAPKGYEDLIDPVLSPLWAGKMAIPLHSLAGSIVGKLGEGESLGVRPQARALSGGRLRQGEEERIVSGEFPIMASTGGALKRCGSGKPKARR